MRIWHASIFCLFSGMLMADSGDKRLMPLSTQSLLETSGGLLLILLLIIGGAWLFKRYGQLPMAGKNLISILGGVSVGPRERVVVLKIENTRLVVGIAPGQVRTLHVLDPEEPLETSFESQYAVVQQDKAGA